MKAKSYIFIFSILLLTITISCSSDSEEEESNPFDLRVEIEKLSYGVDELVDFDIISEVDLSRIEVGIDILNDRIGQSSRFTSGQNLGKEFEHSYILTTVGPRKIYVVATDLEGRQSRFEFDIEVGLSNTVKINSISINSFEGFGATYDDEFPESDENRLADLYVFTEKKYRNVRLNQPNSYDSDWFVTEVFENESNRSWDVSQENYIIGDKTPFKFWLYDDDSVTFSEIMFSPRGYLIFDFSEYIETKPNQVVFEDESLSLEIVFDVQWN